MNEERLRAFQELAPLLNALRPDPNARVSYELMSDSLMWSDELPDPSEFPSTGITCLRGAFRYRTTLMLGKAEERFRPSWELLQTLCPDWPVFLPERRRPDADRIRFFEEAQARMSTVWEDLDERFRRQESERKAAASKAGV